MRILKIDYERCGEYDKTEYYVITDGIDSDSIDNIIIKAQQKYLDAVKAYKSLMPLSSKPENDINLISDNSITVGAVKHQIDLYNKLLHEHDSRESDMVNSFTIYLEQAGLVPLYKYKGNDIHNKTLDWGHQHSLNLDY